MVLCCIEWGNLNLLNFSWLVHLARVTHQALRAACILVRSHTACKGHLSHLKNTTSLSLWSPQHSFNHKGNPQENGVGEGEGDLHKRTIYMIQKESHTYKMPRLHIWHRGPAKLMVTKEDGNSVSKI